MSVDGKMLGFCVSLNDVKFDYENDKLTMKSILIT
ncbi:hypothetical protein SLEP1_g48894 [Rubroshorea leprosula]|uniref:Uncharacterized protein n=1 Tax=Rubroshorea leprosula TaxID=152421 RepID=A0AAV5LVY2_9ROSI|nr:hypothetical protein SLEP1_g48894 [Rubroshorea leprosula]